MSDQIKTNKNVFERIDNDLFICDVWFSLAGLHKKHICFSLG